MEESWSGGGVEEKGNMGGWRVICYAMEGGVC